MRAATTGIIWIVLWWLAPVHVRAATTGIIWIAAHAAHRSLRRRGIERRCTGLLDGDAPRILIGGQIGHLLRRTHGRDVDTETRIHSRTHRRRSTHGRSTHVLGVAGHRLVGNSVLTRTLRLRDIRHYSPRFKQLTRWFNPVPYVLDVLGFAGPVDQKPVPSLITQPAVYR